MGLLSAVISARQLLQRHFPDPKSNDPRTRNCVFDGGADSGTFNEALLSTFQWFVTVEDATLRLCLNLPQWVREVRGALRRVDAEATSAPAQDRWGRFLATP